MCLVLTRNPSDMDVITALYPRDAGVILGCVDKRALRGRRGGMEA